VSRRRYFRNVAIVIAAYAAAWLISFEPWPVALRTVILINVMFLILDGTRYWLWRRRRAAQDLKV
jgi:hypothetical protein